MEAGSEPIKSYFDTTTGFIFFNVVAPAGIPEAMEILSAANRRRKESPQHRDEYLNTVTALVGVQHYPLITHEWAHVLQALTHPALYLRCLREFSSVCGIVDELRKAPYAVPAPFYPGGAWAADLSMPTHPMRLSITAEGLPVVEASTSRWPLPNDLSETDLLEDSASIFQYKAEIGGDGAARGYRRWLDEGHRYSKTYSYLSEVLSPDDAYVALPCLVMAANMTIWPLHSFVSMLATTVRVGLAPAGELGIDLYWSYLELLLTRSCDRGEAPDPRRTMREDDAQRRIDRDGMLRLAAGWSSHPLTPLVELAWGEERNLRRLRGAILHPGQAFNRRRQEAESWLHRYRAPVTAFRLLGEDLGPGDTVLMVSPTILDRDVPAAGMSWQDYLVELMRMRSFVFSTATQFTRGLPHNCPHRDCAYHEYEMCRAWMHIPSSSEKCIFPDWLRQSAHRSLDFDTNTLVPVG